MIATFVHIWVRPDELDRFLAATVENHHETRREKGNIRFDVLRDEADRNKFVLYEVFESDEAIALHKTMPHYLKWRNTVADMMTRPREGVRHEVIEPADRAEW